MNNDNDVLQCLTKFVMKILLSIVNNGYNDHNIVVYSTLLLQHCNAFNNIVIRIVVDLVFQVFRCSNSERLPISHTADA